MFIQALKAPNRSTPIKEVFSLGLKDLIKLLINIELFQPISFAQWLNLKKYTKKPFFLSYMVYLSLSGSLAVQVTVYSFKKYNQALY